MSRTTLATLTYATILIAPLAATIGYFALTPASTPAPAIPEPPAPIVATPAVPPVAPPVAPPAPVIAAPIVTEPVAPPAPTAPAPAPTIVSGPGDAVIVYEHQLALSTDGELEWTVGEARSNSPTGSAASKAVDTALLPDPLKPLVGAAFNLYSADGGQCTANTGAFSLYGRLDREPEYTDADGNSRPPTPAELQTMPASVIEFASLLLAGLADDATCDGVWARRADFTPPTVFGLVALDEASRAALQPKLLALLDAHPDIAGLRNAYKTFRRDKIKENKESAAYDKAHPDEVNPEAAPRQTPPAWDEFLRTSLTLTRWDEVGGSRKLLNVVVGRDGDMCEVFVDKAAVIFTLEGDGPQTMPGPGFLGPRAIMDVERDGKLEAVVSHGKLETRGPNPFPSFDFDPIECPC